MSSFAIGERLCLAEKTGLFLPWASRIVGKPVKAADFLHQSRIAILPMVLDRFDAALPELKRLAGYRKSSKARRRAAFVRRGHMGMVCRSPRLQKIL